MIKNHSSTSKTCPKCGIILLSAEDAARIIGISYPRVRAILNTHPERLSAFKIGNIWIIPEQAARKFQPFPPHRPKMQKRT